MRGRGCCRKSSQPLADIQFESELCLRLISATQRERRLAFPFPFVFLGNITNKYYSYAALHAAIEATKWQFHNKLTAQPGRQTNIHFRNSIYEDMISHTHTHTHTLYNTHGKGSKEKLQWKLSKWPSNSISENKTSESAKNIHNFHQHTQPAHTHTQREENMMAEKHKSKNIKIYEARQSAGQMILPGRRVCPCLWAQDDTQGLLGRT